MATYTVGPPAVTVGYSEERVNMIAAQVAAISRSLDDIDRQLAEIRQHVRALELTQPPPAKRPWQIDDDELDAVA